MECAFYAGAAAADRLRSLPASGTLRILLLRCAVKDFWAVFCFVGALRRFCCYVFSLFATVTQPGFVLIRLSSASVAAVFVVVAGVILVMHLLSTSRWKAETAGFTIYHGWMIKTHEFCDNQTLVHIIKVYAQGSLSDQKDHNI